jgi:hypothetical protein
MRVWTVLVVVASLGLSTASRAQQVARPAASDAGAAPDSLLLQRERAQWDALKTQDTTAFARLMGGDLVDVDVSGIKRTSPASVSRYVAGCRTASYALSDVRVGHYAATAVVTYKATVEATCWGQKAPSPVYVMTVYERRDNAWLPVAHSETPAARR